MHECPHASRGDTISVPMYAFTLLTAQQLPNFHTYRDGTPQAPLPKQHARMQGEIEFGVINQSQSAFSHILSDVSLVVYQFEALAGYSAVVDRLGQFQEAIEARGKVAPAGDAEDYVMDPTSEIELADTPADASGAPPLSPNSAAEHAALTHSQVQAQPVGLRGPAVRGCPCLYRCPHA